MDGVPDVTQAPIKPGETFTYDFVAKGPRSACTTRTTTRRTRCRTACSASSRSATTPLPAGTGPVTQEVRWC